MPNRYKVPQNVEAEDTLVGSLTLRQLLKLFTGGVLVYTIYLSYPNFFFVLGPIVIIFTLLFTFAKINEQPFEKFLWSAINFYFSPRKRIWKKIPETIEKEENITPQKTNKKPIRKKVSRGELEKLAYILDTRGYLEEEKKSQETDLEVLKEKLIEKRSHTEEKDLPDSIEDIFKNKQ